MANLYIGTSGFTIQNFYPETTISKQKLKFYSTKFQTVEINSCFYHLPTLKTLTAWKEAVTNDFIFSFKVWKEVTHSSEELFNKEKLEIWLERFSVFANSGHIFLFQFPASVHADLNSLKELIENLPQDFKYVFEFRHTSWFTQEVYSMLADNKCSLVVSDSPVKADKTRTWPLMDIQGNSITYVRFHGSKKLYYSSYDDKELLEYAEFIREKIKFGKDVFCYFNNDAEGMAASNAQSLIKLL